MEETKLEENKINEIENKDEKNENKIENNNENKEETNDLKKYPLNIIYCGGLAFL